jgi:hypothetical protein
MRIQYSFTSDLGDLADKVKFQLEYFLNKFSVDDSLKGAIQNLEKESLNYSTFFNEVEKIRDQIFKLDLLLKESKEIMVVCQKAELGEYDQGANGAPLADATPPEEKIEKKVKKKSTPEQRDITELKAAMGQINHMATALKDLKRKGNE